MQQLNGRVAVVTGGASGNGRGLVNRFAAEGMKVVVADVEEDPLDQVVQAIRENRFYVLTHPDVALADMRQRPQWMESAIAPEITITRSDHKLRVLATMSLSRAGARKRVIG